MKYHRKKSHRIAARSELSLSRRGVLRAAAGVIAASVTSGPLLLGGGKARAAEKLHFASYGGASGEALEQVFFKPFARETGVEVVQTPPATVAKLKAAQSRVAVEWDVIDWIQADVETAANNGLLEPIDYSIVDAEDIIFPSSRQTYSIARAMYSSGIGYDTQRHPDGKHPTTWAEFWDVKKFPGRRGLRPRPNDTLEIALLAAGIEPKKVYPMDVDLAFKSLNEIKPHITHWVDPAPQTVEFLQKKEVDFNNTLNGRVYAANKAGFQLGFSRKQQLIFFSPLCVPKGAKNPKGAMKLVSYMMDPAKQGAYCEMVANFPMKRKGLDFVSDKLKEQVPDFSSPNHVVINSEWWGAPGRLEQLNLRLKEFLLS